MSDLKAASELNGIQHTFWKAMEWLEGKGNKPTKDDLSDLTAAVAQYKVILLVQNREVAEALKATDELFLWLKKAVQEKT